MLFRTISTITCALFAILILIFSLIPETPKEFIQLSDKANHVIAYFLLAISLFFSLKSKNMHMILLISITIGACTLYGGIIEGMQSFTGRTTEMMDIFADFIGAAAGAGSAQIILIIKKKLGY